MVRISSENIDDISLATLSLEGDRLAKYSEADRLWYSAAALNQRTIKIDYHTLPTAASLSMQTPGTGSRRSRHPFPPSPSPSSNTASSQYVSCEHSSKSESVNEESRSDSNLTSRSASPHPIQCRCGAQGDGNLMIDGLDTVLCVTCGKYSHIACQRSGRANHIPSGEDFECSECLGEDSGLPGAISQ